MSFQAKGKFHRKFELDTVPGSKHTVSVSSSRQKKFGIIGSLNTTAPVKLSERQTKVRHVSRTVFRRPTSSESQRALERRVTPDRDLIWDGQVAPETQSLHSPSSLEGSPVHSPSSIERLSSGCNEPLPLDAGILDEQSQQSATHWSVDGASAGVENGQSLQSGHVSVLGGTEQEEETSIDDQLLAPGSDDSRIIAGGRSSGSLVSSASGYSDTSLHTLDHQMLAGSVESQESLQTSVPESVRASSLPLINQERDREDKSSMGDQGDGSDGDTLLVLAEAASASETALELQDRQTSPVNIEKDRGEKGKTREDAPTTGSSPPTTRQPSDANAASEKSDLVVSGACAAMISMSAIAVFSH